MKTYKFDVVIIGAGPAGVTAAGALAGTGISVALLEAGVYAGAENWSGCVYFAESLAEKDCFGPEAVAQAPFERQVHRRGTLMHNGLDAVGLELTEPAIFSNCYTVLRPFYDPYFAHLARAKGAVHITETTVTSLIRKDSRVIGVQTNRGPLYADVVFIAEGDASHLVRSERLEQVTQPHFLQGVKAVLSLKSEEIEKRFRLAPGQGAAYELLIRNASIGGRTAKLNMGGFLYTNRDSLSLGYVLPLDNLRKNYRGNHDTLFEWMRGLPYLRELTNGAALSAYGAKIIRSGGWKERPVLVEDGLAVGGAATGLGVDIPFPNFTGPASATGLYFARAVKSLLRQGKALDAANLTREYLAPVKESVYGRNARFLSAWPGYFGRSSVLFGRTVDMACGTAHFLSTGSLVETGRFLRSHLLSFRGWKDIVTDNVIAISSLRLWKPVLTALFHPATLGRWIINSAAKAPAQDPGLGIILHISGKNVDAAKLPWPVASLIKRLSPALLAALEQVYANDKQPIQAKLAKAAQALVRGIGIGDLILLPAFGLGLMCIALGTAVYDAFRYYVLKTPVAKLLAEPVMAYNESQKKARDLDAIKPAIGLDAKLATNTYVVGSVPHIRTLWPEALASHPDMSQAGLWWVCPARVYVYEAPLFGRGKVTVNYENCIKCESCWRAEPARVLWGRHTNHKLIYRPQSAAFPILLDALGKDFGAPGIPPGSSGKIDVHVEEVWYLTNEVKGLCGSALSASAAFQDAVAKLPASADHGRKAWPLALGRRLGEKLRKLETALANDGRHGLTQNIQTLRKDLELRLAEGGLFHAIYRCHVLDQNLSLWAGNHDRLPNEAARKNPITYEEVSALFPDRVVKQWEEAPLSEEWAGTLRAFIDGHRADPLPCIRALAAKSPALGLIAAHQLSAVSLLERAGIKLEPGICAVTGAHLDIQETIDSVRIKGTLNLVPQAGSHTLLVLAQGKGHLVPLSTPGVTIIPTPAIGFRAAGMADITLDCPVKKLAIITQERESSLDTASYLAIALGAGDYLCARIKEHALGRIQFPGQMLDTEGRDGIAKLGAVKALIARTEAWRLLLETLYDVEVHSELRTPNSALLLSLLRSSVAAMAFSPEPGTMGYDAGQVFGGFAYSEDDLLSRFYRDSSLFRFLPPGYGASAHLHTLLGTDSFDQASSALGGLEGLRAEPLGPIAARLALIAKQCSLIPPQADAACAGEAEALALSLRCLLLSIEQGLNKGQSMEKDAACAEVLLGLAEEAVMKALLSAGRGNVSPSAVFPIEATGDPVALDMEYETFCTFPDEPHKSGAFLLTSFDRSPRFVPEMQLHDKKLRARWIELAGWFRKNCGEKQFGGLHIERAIEKRHGLPDEVIEAVKKNKWLATTIPQSEDGLGWRKAEYYILNSAAGSFGDAGINLLIMASTSIGTTPILLGLQDELPRVREELAPLAQDPNRLGEIASRLEKLVRSLQNPNPAWIKKEYEAVMKLVDARIRRTRVVKYLSANFLRSFYGAGLAGKRGDFGGFMMNLKRAGELFEKVMPDVRAALEELPRRERCHKLFLRTLGHGGVSAFALTEPTAGSDSGGVKTLAKLLQSKISPLGDGRYSFLLAEQDPATVRYLIDADRIVFNDDGMAYQTPDGHAAAIRYDSYDYATDQGVRYYTFNNTRCEFHDIGQIRNTGPGLAYEYYSLTGAKMWITNGSIATQFCLYAQTPEGVTGFMVDRHAEGLKVGADESKMGQRGSPTNEISIDSARVPREAVIGYEGHGQVNALETLNVGRCGLSVVSGALMRKLMREAAENIPATPERDALLGEAAAIQFGSESMAYYLVGLFDRAHESVRMESAIAKYACSEDIHEFMSLVERAFGPAGQIEKYLLEKARRDSRILTIYEGTNEVQRFLIIKDLMAQAAAWPELPEPLNDARAATLVSWKNRLRKFVKDAATLLGDAGWSDAMLQPALFPLAEIAGELLRLECIYFRMEWLDERTGLLGNTYAAPLLKAGERAVQRTLSRLAHLDALYSATWQQVARGMDAPEVRAADAALDLLEKTEMPAGEDSRALQARLRILSIVRPIADLSPAPTLSEGGIGELVWKIDPLDQAGLTQALALKAGNGAQVMLDVLMVGHARHEHLLCAKAGAKAGRLVRLNGENTSPAELANAVRTLELLKPYDLIITGSLCLNGDQGTGAYLAGSLKRTFYRKELIQVRQDGLGLERLATPSVVSITAPVAETVMDMTTAVESGSAQVMVLEPRQKTASAASYAKPMTARVTSKVITTVIDAAEYIKRYASAAGSVHREDYSAEAGRGRLQDDNAVWALLDPREQKSNTTVLRTARQIADLLARPMSAFIPAPKDSWPALLGAARANGANQAFCMNTAHGMLSIEGKRETLRLIVKTANTPLVVASNYWTDVFGFISGETSHASKSIPLFGDIIEISASGKNSLLLSQPAYDGKLIRKEPAEDGRAFISVAHDAEFPSASPQDSFTASELDSTPGLEWVMPLPPETGQNLAQAEVIIDLGYGIKDHSGLTIARELAERLKALGLTPMFGATRKVTQDLKLQPLEAQIGQTGVRVNPKLIIALGISGAPQHIDYLGTRAEILCFNKDADAPLMKLNESRSAPHVHPIEGDLFATVRQLIGILARE